MRFIVTNSFLLRKLDLIFSDINKVLAFVRTIKETTSQTLIVADTRFGEEVNTKVAEDALNVTDPEAEILSLANSGTVDQE